MAPPTEKKTGAWSAEEDNSILMQVLHHGPSVKGKDLQVPGRTERALSERLSLLKKKAAEEFGKGADGPVTPKAAKIKGDRPEEAAEAADGPSQPKANLKRKSPKKGGKVKRPTKKAKLEDTETSDNGFDSEATTDQYEA